MVTVINKYSKKILVETILSFIQIKNFWLFQYPFINVKYLLKVKTVKLYIKVNYLCKYEVSDSTSDARKKSLAWSSTRNSYCTRTSSVRSKISHKNMKEVRQTPSIMRSHVCTVTFLVAKHHKIQNQ